MSSPSSKTDSTNVMDHAKNPSANAAYLLNPRAFRSPSGKIKGWSHAPGPRFHEQIAGYTFNINASTHALL